MMVLAEQAEGELVGDRFAFALCAGGQQLLDAHGRDVGRRMRGEPGRIAAAGRVAGDIDEIFDGEAQAAKWAVLGWRKCELLDECAGLFDGNGLHGRLLYRALANVLPCRNLIHAEAKKRSRKGTEIAKSENSSRQTIAPLRETVCILIVQLIELARHTYGYDDLINLLLMRRRVCEKCRRPKRVRSKRRARC